MPEVAKLRKRKPQSSKASPPNNDEQPLPNSDNTQGRDDDGFSNFSASYVLTPVVVILGILCYLYPSLLTEFVNSWIGFSDEWEPGVPSYTQIPQDFLSADIERRDAVVTAFKHAWLSYERDAMGDDEYHPISRAGSNLTKAGGIGYTVIDSIDTMILMGLNSEYYRAKTWVDKRLSFDRDDTFSTFETTIRVLGGLLSAYHLSYKDPLYLKKAIDLADRMLPAFNTPSGLPLSYINLKQRKGFPQTDFPTLVTIAEVSTLQLEFRYLSEVTGNDVYWKVAEKVMQVIKAARLPHGLASVYMEYENGQFVTSAIGVGSRGDSFYEYLLKQYIQTNRTELVYRDMYDDAMTSIHSHLIQKSINSGLTYTAELIPEQNKAGDISWRLTPKQDHLACFLGGSLMLGATQTGNIVDVVSVPPQPDQLSISGMRDWKSGVELLRTCLKTHDTATGLSPEVVHFRIASDGMDAFPNAPSDFYIKGAQLGMPAPYAARYQLRPETIESLFIAYRLTGDARYREHGWNIFQSIERHCRVATGGYATIVNVDEVPAQMEDKMETFFMSETLKYLYLLFSDSSVLPLDKYVYNTEAHPFPIFNPKIPTGFA